MFFTNWIHLYLRLAHGGARVFSRKRHTGSYNSLLRASNEASKEEGGYYQCLALISSKPMFLFIFLPLHPLIHI